MRDSGLEIEVARIDSHEPGDGQTVAQLAILIAIVIVGAVLYYLTEMAL